MMRSQWTVVPVDGEQMWAYLSIPGQAGPYPGVIAAPTGLGIDDWIQEMADKLAAEGYATIVPDLYHRDPPKVTYFRDRLARLRDTNIVRDIDASFVHLSKHPLVRSDSIGILGFCLGGRVAYLCAGSTPTFQAAACFYGRDIMVAWGDGASPFQKTAEINCPFLGFWGNDDPNPTPQDVALFDKEFRRNQATYQFHCYENAGHTYMSDRTEEYRAEAAEDSWGKLLEWFDKYLQRAEA